ncbi:MAG: hypothetical protein JWO48_1469 [Bryobacterales bacterium]|nr:hypothetical protein [Bryobacterales bacterium]
MPGGTPFEVHEANTQGARVLGAYRCKQISTGLYEA